MGTFLLRDFVIANERMDSFPQKTHCGIWQKNWRTVILNFKTADAFCV